MVKKALADVRTTDVQAAWKEIRRRADVLVAVDVSGSMASPVATGESRLALATSAIDAARVQVFVLAFGGQSCEAGSLPGLGRSNVDCYEAGDAASLRHALDQISASLWGITSRE